MEKVIEMLQEEGIRDSLVVMIGGAPVSPEFAEQIGPDSTHPDSIKTTEWAKDAVSKLVPAEQRWNKEKISLNVVKYREGLAKKKIKGKTDIGLETAKQIISDFENLTVKKKEIMTHMDRTMAAMNDKKVDRLPVYPLACGVLRKFADVNYKQYATDINSFVKSAYLGSKYLDTDMFVGLIDLSATSADFGCKIKYPEDDTPSSEGHLKTYEEIDIKRAFHPCS